MTEERGLTMEDRGRPGQALLEQHINRMVTLSPGAAILRSVRGGQHHRQRPADGQIENGHLVYLNRHIGFRFSIFGQEWVSKKEQRDIVGIVNRKGFPFYSGRFPGGE